MSAVPTQSVTHAASLVAQAEELLEEHHVVAYSRNIGVRERFALELIKHLHAMIEVQTVVLSGTGIHDLETFCRQFDRTMPGTRERTRPTIDGPGGVCDRMRDRPSDLASHIKHRYYIWRDADVLLKQNPKLFARLADAMMGVAAESEYASEDLLLLHRVVFIGAPALHTSYRDSNGPLRSWLADAPHGGKPLWAVVTGIESPPTAELLLA